MFRLHLPQISPARVASPTAPTLSAPDRMASTIAPLLTASHTQIHTA